MMRLDTDQYNQLVSMIRWVIHETRIVHDRGRGRWVVKLPGGQVVGDHADHPQAGLQLQRERARIVLTHLGWPEAGYYLPDPMTRRYKIYDLCMDALEVARIARAFEVGWHGKPGPNRCRSKLNFLRSSG